MKKSFVVDDALVSLNGKEVELYYHLIEDYASDYRESEIYFMIFEPTFSVDKWTIEKIADFILKIVKEEDGLEYDDIKVLNVSYHTIEESDIKIFHKS